MGGRKYTERVTKNRQLPQSPLSVGMGCMLVFVRQRGAERTCDCTLLAVQEWWFGKLPFPLWKAAVALWRRLLFIPLWECCVPGKQEGFKWVFGQYAQWLESNCSLRAEVPKLGLSLLREWKQQNWDNHAAAGGKGFISLIGGTLESLPPPKPS